MFSWLFKEKHPHDACKYKHLKSFGEPHLDNMKTLIEFTPYEKDSEIMPLSIYECEHCGYRALGCLYLVCATDAQLEQVELFRNDEMSYENFIALLDKFKWKYKEQKTYLKKQKQ